MMNKEKIVELIEKIIPQRHQLEELPFSRKEDDLVIEYLILRKAGEDREINDDDSLKNDVGLDSLEIFEVGYDLEYLYSPLIEGSRIPGKIMEKWKTVKDIKDYIKNL